MKNSFLFIIPLTPQNHLTPIRKLLRGICLNNLIKQNYTNWKAILIGDSSDINIFHDNFLYINEEGLKEEKIQLVYEYYKNNKLNFDYIIRLDDDDIFNPNILNEIKDKSFDIYVDKYHSFLNCENGHIAQTIKFWFPNTCIIKTKYAFTEFGHFPFGNYRKSKNKPLLFENEHNHFHWFFNSKYKILFSKKSNPVYLRILSRFSITSQTNHDYNNYLRQFGFWTKNELQSFYFLNEFFTEGNNLPYKVSLLDNLKHYKQSFFSWIIYKKRISKIDKLSFQITNSGIINCSRCVLNSNDVKSITFNSDGLCNYCEYYDSKTSKLGDENFKKEWLKNKITEIKSKGKSASYDCILGVSGGVDSTYLAHWCSENNLKPLVVHFDNGWNSELATKNIERICNVYGFELNTYVIQWEEFKELQLAFLRAGVIDIEMLTDHAIYSTLTKVAKKFKIQHIISGFNLSTEAIMPKDWVFDKLDWENIKDIYSKFGSGKKIKNFPHTSFFKKIYNYWGFKTETIQVLNYMEYNKEEAKETIKREIGWIDYGGKHHESVFTKFYQSYILPVKFNVDKRKAHLSTLICSNQITKEKAFEELRELPYNIATIVSEKEYVLKKLGLSNEEFDNLMSQKPRLHTDFKTEKALWNSYFKVIKLIKFWDK